MMFKAAYTLSQRTKTPELPDCVSDLELANEFSEYFISKISTIRQNLDACAPDTADSTAEHMEESTNASLTSFTLASLDEIRKIIQKSALKSCSSDPVPTWLLKEHLEVMLPVITDTVNLSLSTGVFLEQMKYASVKPLLKKSGLDRN